MRLDLPPKLYDLRAYGTQTNSELIITVAPGQTRFLLAQPTPTGGAELLELSQEQGRNARAQGRAAVDARARRQLLIAIHVFTARALMNLRGVARKSRRSTRSGRRTS